MTSFEITADNNARLSNVTTYQGPSLARNVLNFSLDNFISTHNGEGNSIYFGKFNGSSAHGLGVKLDEDGRYSAGYFSKGKLSGVCKVALPENDMFFGNMKDDFPEGEGLFYDSVRKAWLYGFFKDFECVTLVKEGIANALPYKKRIFLNLFETSKANERCPIDIPLVDFGKDLMKQLEPHLAAILSQLSEHDQLTVTAGSMVSHAIAEINIEKVKIRDADNPRYASGERKKKKHHADIAPNRIKGSADKKRAKSANKAIDEGYDDRSQSAVQRGENYVGGFTHKSNDSMGQGSIEQLANFNIGQFGLKNNSRLGTINEGEEDFCRSKSSVGDKTPKGANGNTNILQTRLFQGSNIGTGHVTFSSKNIFSERVPSPKPITHEVLSPDRIEQHRGFELQWQKIKGKGNSSSFSGTTPYNPSHTSITSDQRSKKTNSRSQIDHKIHVQDDLHNAGSSITKLSKQLKSQQSMKIPTNSDLKQSSEQWAKDEQIKFQHALQKLNRLDQLVYHLQQQVSRSRATQIIF